MSGHVKNPNPKVRKRLRRKVSIRLRMSGTAERPRLSVFRSARYIYVQAIDDVSNRILASASDQAGPVAGEVAGKKKKERARAVGQAIGKKLRELNVESVVFDRNGFIYHGRVKEVADGAREAGLQF
jgi:large subunit ribosomal protein L18